MELGDERQRMRKVAKDMDGAMLAGMGVVCRLSAYAPGGKRSSRLRLCSRSLSHNAVQL